MNETNYFITDDNMLGKLYDADDIKLRPLDKEAEDLVENVPREGGYYHSHALIKNTDGSYSFILQTIISLPSMPKMS